MAPTAARQRCLVIYNSDNLPRYKLGQYIWSSMIWTILMQKDKSTMQILSDYTDFLKNERKF